MTTSPISCITRIRLVHGSHVSITVFMYSPASRFLELEIFAHAHFFRKSTPGGVGRENVVMASYREGDMSKENDFFPNQEEYLLFHPSQRLSQRPSLFSDTDSEGDVSIIPSTPKVHMQGGKSHLPSGKNLLNEFVAAKAR